MRIVSLNAWGGAMYEPLAEWLPECGSDVLCLQEVTRTAGLGGWTRFEDGERTLPQRANLFADVSAALPAHQGVFVTSDSGPVGDEHGARHQQDFGLAMSCTSDFRSSASAQTSFMGRSSSTTSG